ncbi:MAG: oxygen-dependent coproporphyrinogen oxidase [Planctomycetes bacterium]|nr:oxygen-dependent coproporphyrinogen oxidase [Planctomycetota bacterium]
MRQQCSTFVKDLQTEIIGKLGPLDGGTFHVDDWVREGGGGGSTRVLSGGTLFEKAGVNVSEVHGRLQGELAEKLRGDGDTFYGTGISLVLHPRHPRVPTVHANFRYIERGNAWWFGGGADMTPYRLYPDDARHFHATWRAVCERHDPTYYPRFKKWCDDYFYLPHRQEARGIGGIFFDDLDGDFDKLFAFWTDAGNSFLSAYVPIVERRRSERFTEEDREFQLIRRGRYVEFNLMYDRGTVFGLKTGGRIESILMSLPPEVRWEYNMTWPDGSPEAELIDALRQPRDWLGINDDSQ